MTLSLRALDAVAAALERVTSAVTRHLGNGAWDLLHAMGAHRWREAWEVNLERGWRQYRGSRCAVCDVPWEGW